MCHRRMPNQVIKGVVSGRRGCLLPTIRGTMTKGTRSEQFIKLQDANKKLRSQVRQLRKQLKDAEQNLQLLQDIWQAELSELKAFRQSRKTPKPETICPECGNPTLIHSTVGIWSMESCSACEHTDKRKN